MHTPSGLASSSGVIDHTQGCIQLLRRLARAWPPSSALQSHPSRLTPEHGSMQAQCHRRLVRNVRAVMGKGCPAATKVPSLCTSSPASSGAARRARVAGGESRRGTMAYARGWRNGHRRGRMHTNRQSSAHGTAKAQAIAVGTIPKLEQRGGANRAGVGWRHTASW